MSLVYVGSVLARKRLFHMNAMGLFAAVSTRLGMQMDTARLNGQQRQTG
jgi:hypothetical protein